MAPGDRVRSIFCDREGVVADIYHGLCGVMVTYRLSDGRHAAQDIATLYRVTEQRRDAA